MKTLADCPVLLVDDARASLDNLVEALKSGHKLSLAFNGNLAWQAASRRLPEALLEIAVRHLGKHQP